MKKEHLFEILRFGTVGGVCTLVNLFTQWFLMINLGLTIYTALVFGFIISSIIGFLLNNKWVFKQEKIKHEEIVKFYLSYGFVYIILAWLLAYLWVNLLGINELIAPILSMIIQVPTAFLLNKFLVFKK